MIYTIAKCPPTSYNSGGLTGIQPCCLTTGAPSNSEHPTALVTANEPKADSLGYVANTYLCFVCQNRFKVLLFSAFETESHSLY